MKIENLKSLLMEFSDNVKFEHDLKKKNWFNIGGKTKVFYKADNLKELINFLKKLDSKEKLFILGAGSNTLITDNLYDGVVIKLSNNFIKNTVKLALNEDLFPVGDITSNLIRNDKIIEVKLISNQDAIIGGLKFAKSAFNLVDKRIKFSKLLFLNNNEIDGIFNEIV